MEGICIIFKGYEMCNNILYFSASSSLDTVCQYFLAYQLFLFSGFVFL
jgi:hypothetical protein